MGAVTDSARTAVFLAALVLLPYSYARAARGVARRWDIRIDGWPWWVGVGTTLVGLAFIALLTGSNPGLTLIAALIGLSVWLQARHRDRSSHAS